MILRTVLYLLAFLSSVVADVQFTSPTAGQTISGSSISVEWTDSGTAPALTDLTSYILQLCAGSNTNYIPIVTFTNTGTPSSESYTAKITDLTVGDSTTNAYFLLMTSAATGGVVKNFSPRFTLSGMTGKFSAAIVAALADVSGTDGPDTVNNIGTNAAAAAAAAATAATVPAVGADVYNTPYTMQTGPIRYAPMPKVAPTKITKKGGYSAQFPTSAWHVYTDRNQPTANAQQTITEAFTFSVSSMEATIAAQANPIDADMQKFLNRWKD